MAETNLKLGSLFSGIGGFELVGSWYGIEPVWASEIESSPIRITSRHFPNMKHLGDIIKIHGDEIEPVDVITGGSPCFPAGTLILTDKGYIPIESVKIGDVVLTHKGNWKKVTAVGNRKAETYYLKGNITIETTENHPIYSADIKWKGFHNPNGKRSRKKELSDIGKWTPAINMGGKQWATPAASNELPIPTVHKIDINQKDMPVMNAEFWYFVGRWLGDGWVRDGFRADKPNGAGHGIIFLCDSYDKLSELEATVSKVSNHYSTSKEKTVVKVKFCSQLLCKWLTENFGKGAINKTIPGWVLSLPKEQ
ncbi:MAG: DNA cytosine methyltransferase [Lachnospiraceae bacterium]|nr:DNA cytosine methyltransferase [Lachnospiraceae bacterium]MCM1232845.1 DNA cytosine methyltransferase [Ruminococcus flavefaciens]